jgi:hypothetical protein
VPRLYPSVTEIDIGWADRRGGIGGGGFDRNLGDNADPLVIALSFTEGYKSAALPAVRCPIQSSSFQQHA